MGTGALDPGTKGAGDEMGGGTLNETDSFPFCATLTSGGQRAAPPSSACTCGRGRPCRLFTTPTWGPSTRPGSSRRAIPKCRTLPSRMDSAKTSCFAGWPPLSGGPSPRLGRRWGAGPKTNLDVLEATDFEAVPGHDVRATVVRRARPRDGLHRFLRRGHRDAPAAPGSGGGVGVLVPAPSYHSANPPGSPNEAPQTSEVPETSEVSGQVRTSYL